MLMIDLDPVIWGPHYWFFLHTLSMTYPKHPNDVVKKKYYDFIQNLPLFIPHSKMSKSFSDMLDIYPVSPYLDSKDSFIRWIHFIHNKVNKKIELPQISMSKFYTDYYENYKTRDVKYIEYAKTKRHILYGILIVLLFGTIYFLYNK
jgi:hypothetical protein